MDAGRSAQPGVPAGPACAEHTERPPDQRRTRISHLAAYDACVRGTALFVLIRRLLFFALPEPGERKGRGGWARPAAPRPCSHGPEVPRPHPAALWSLVCCEAGLFWVGERGTCCSALPCASGRGHLGSARRCVLGGRGTGAAPARPHPLSRQSRGLSAIHRFSGSALPLLLPPSYPNRGGETPVSPGRSIWWAGLLQPGVSSPASPGAIGSGNCIRLCNADMNEVNVYVAQPVPRVVRQSHLPSTRQRTAVFLPHGCQADDGQAPR